MEAEDILSDEVDIGRPEFLIQLPIPVIADSRQIIIEGVEPDINGVIGIVRHLDGPFDSRPGDAQVFQSLLDEADHFVHPALGPHEFRMPAVKIQELVLVGGESEEITLLRDEPALFAAVRADFMAFFFEGDIFGEKVFIGDAVVSFVDALVDIAFVFQFLKDLLDAFFVDVLCGADEKVIVDVQ